MSISSAIIQAYGNSFKLSIKSTPYMTKHKQKQDAVRRTIARKHNDASLARINKHGLFTAAMCDKAREDEANKKLARLLELHTL